MTPPGMTTRPPRRLVRSALAILAGLVAIVALSMAADEVATAYRGLIGVFGCWLAARLAPHHPMRHALIVGGIGLVLSTAGLLAALNANLGPVWYPAALLVITMPCAWLGGRLYRGGRA